MAGGGIVDALLCGWTTRWREQEAELGRSRLVDRGARGVEPFRFGPSGWGRAVVGTAGVWGRREVV